MEPEEIEKLRNDIATLTYDELNNKLDEVNTVIGKLEADLKSHQTEKGNLESQHPGLNKDSPHGKLWSIVQRPEEYRQEVMVHLLIRP
jgi:hypothetical protein